MKVLIINEDGHYLSGTATHWEFTEDRMRARVFDYVRDHVADQITLVRNVYGKAWFAVKLDPHEAYEFCDRCGARTLPVRAYFDGQRFLCPHCREDEQPATDLGKDI